MGPRDLRVIAAELGRWADVLDRWAELGAEVGPSTSPRAAAAPIARGPGRAQRANEKVTRQLSNGEVIQLVRPYIAEPGDYDASEEAYSEADASELGERVAGALWIENDAAPDVDWRRAVIKARANLARHISRTGR